MFTAEISPVGLWTVSAYGSSPGVPAGIAMPSYAGVPVTYPGGGDTLTFVRGYEDVKVRSVGRFREQASGLLLQLGVTDLVSLAAGDREPAGHLQHTDPGLLGEQRQQSAVEWV